MKIDLAIDPVFFFRLRGGTPLICDKTAMLKELYRIIQAHEPIYEVKELRPTLRFRILPKREIRELARIACHVDNSITLEEFTVLDFWYK